jgi:hypothetical protein
MPSSTINDRLLSGGNRRLGQHYPAIDHFGEIYEKGSDPRRASVHLSRTLEGTDFGSH